MAVRQQELLGAIRVGMTVEDADGDKVGAVGEVCVPASAGLNPSAHHAAAYLKVSVGLLSIGGHWYIPLNAIRTVVDDRVILDEDQTKLGDLGFDKPPVNG